MLECLSEYEEAHGIKNLFIVHDAEIFSNQHLMKGFTLKLSGSIKTNCYVSKEVL